MIELSRARLGRRGLPDVIRRTAAIHLELPVKANDLKETVFLAGVDKHLEEEIPATLPPTVTNRLSGVFLPM